MTVCNLDMWLNGVILTSIGSGLLVTAMIIKTSMKSTQEEKKYADQIDTKLKLMAESDIENSVEKKETIIRARVIPKHIDF
jgi:hypothetical protein